MSGGDNEDLFSHEFTLHLDRVYGNPQGDFPKYLSDELVGKSGNKSVVSGVYIARSWLPEALPERIRVRFEAMD